MGWGGGRKWCPVGCSTPRRRAFSCECCLPCHLHGHLAQPPGTATSPLPSLPDCPSSYSPPPCRFTLSRLTTPFFPCFVPHSRSPPPHLTPGGPHSSLPLPPLLPSLTFVSPPLHPCCRPPPAPQADFVEKSVPVLPISGWMGDNLIKKSTNMTWWNGCDAECPDKKKVHITTLLEALNDFVQVTRASFHPSPPPIPLLAPCGGGCQLGAGGCLLAPWPAWPSGWPA